MSDIVIRARDLTKVYRLYSGPGSRFLDMFGMLRNQAGAYSEHAALNGVSLDIKRGEKVAIIGRNGAGKSTFLKLVTRVIEPTSGQLEVTGRTHALLQIGSGFHPDFTGRANVEAYLAQLGISGADARARCAEIVEFAEIEEYIDQPIKTYSSGMAVRLMFATSTAITPDLLVLDEVLGVGDAYFARKSYDRIRDLCSRDRTTLLLVSHDVYSASQICDRMIWLDHGRVLADLPPVDALKMYEDSVRLQEETRLRKKTADVIRREAETGSAVQDTLIVEFAATQLPASSAAHFSRIALYRDGAPVDDAPLTEGRPAGSARLVAEGTNWSAAADWNGRPSRSLLNYGSPFHKVAVAFSAPGLLASARAGTLEIGVEYWTEPGLELAMRPHLNGAALAAGTLPASGGRWVEQRLKITPSDQPVFGTTSTPRAIGTGTIVIRDARMIDEHGQETFVFEHGRPVRFQVDYEVVDPALDEPVGVGVAILKNGVDSTCRFYTPDLHFGGKRSPKGTIELSVAENWLGTGQYSLTVMLTKKGYADRTDHVFYAISPDVYACVRDLVTFEVRGGNLFATGTAVLARGEWSMKDRT